MRTLIKNGRVLDPKTGADETLDILIEDGRIADVKPSIKARDATVIDASRLVVAPGFIDMHVHLREPGQTAKETIESGTRAAARGGFTSVCAMPNTKPPNDERAVTEFVLAQASKKAAVNVFPIAALTKGLLGWEVTDMAELAAAGALAFSDDGRCVQDNRVMTRVFETAKSLDALVIDHCEDRPLWEGGVMNEGAASRRLGLPGIPAAAEDLMVSRDIILAEALGVRVHIAHLSSQGAVRLVREAKARGVPISAEATPHHLLLSDEDVDKKQTSFKVNPPLRSPADVRALVAAVKDGTIDVFATDHAPHSAKDKDVPFEKAPFGMVGLETAVSLLLDRLVGRGVISIMRFVEMMSSTSAALLGLKAKGRIAAGADADLTILNLHKTVTVDAASFASKSRNTPFDGWKLKGAPAITIVGGRVVYPFTP